MSKSGEHELSLTSKKCTEGLNIVKFSYRIDWGLLVEGPTDVVFYKKVTDKLTTFHGSPESYESASIPEIVAAKRQNNQNFFGIIDADYSKHYFPEEIRKYIQVTDANSLETMMIKYYGIDDFEQIIRKIMKNKYPRNKYNLKQKLIDSIVEKSVKWAYTIGILRNYNETRKCLSINKIKCCSNYYLDFLSSSKISDTQVVISFDLEKYLNELVKAKKGNVNITELRKEIENKPFSEEEAFILCQGHDIVDFIEAIIKLYGSEIAKQQTDRNKILNSKRDSSDIVSKIEYDIFDMYDISRFEKAPLYQWLESIDKEYEEKNKESCKN